MKPDMNAAAREALHAVERVYDVAKRADGNDALMRRLHETTVALTWVMREINMLPKQEAK